ncbi:MAG TPA: DUF2332 domain-containing protein [Gaiellaceae bacterium]|nr:DUF2332 domain-containing protein [Gaiellaceae bacterium]
MPEGRHRARPQGARRDRGGRSRGVRQDRRAGEGRARALSGRLEQVFLHQAEQCERYGSPLYAALCRRLATEPAVREILDDERWDRPLQLLGGLHYLALSEGLDPWDDPVPVLQERRDWFRRFVHERGVQTNEVQRSWVLLPCFLEIARRAGVERLDLVELGSSAGFNLVWDRYRHRYAAGDWGPEDAPLVLSGEERVPVPGDLLTVQVGVRHRRGIDRSPIDVTNPDQALLLKSFVWADQRDRLERLDRAVETLRSDPPVLEEGDIAERLSEVLAERQLGALTVVYATAVLSYLGNRQGDVLSSVETAGRQFPLAFVWTGDPRTGEHSYWGLRARLWPDEDELLLAHAGFHGQWLEWLGASA